MAHIKLFTQKAEENCGQTGALTEQVSNLNKLIFVIFEMLCIEAAILNGEPVGHKEIQTLGKRVMNRPMYGDSLVTPKRSSLGTVRYQEKEVTRDELIEKLLKLQAKGTEFLRFVGMNTVTVQTQCEPPKSRGGESSHKKRRETTVLPDVKKLHISIDESPQPPPLYSAHS